MKARRKGTDNPFREIETLEIKGIDYSYFANDVEFEPTPTIGKMLGRGQLLQYYHKVLN